MPNAKMIEGRVLGNERRCNVKIAVQVFDVIRRLLFPVLVGIPPCALERQQWSTELL